MQNRIVTRRTQFSSCDECRRSRVACDSQNRRSVTGKASARCTRCRNRDRACTFKWIQDAKAGASTSHATAPTKGPGRRKRGSRLSIGQVLAEEPASTASTPEVAPTRLESVEEALPAQLSPLSDAEACPFGNSHGEWEWLQALYRQNFEVVFGSWMGRYSCPFLFGQDDPAERYISISDLCCHLDRYMAEMSAGSQDSAQEQWTHDKKRDASIERSLRNTIAAFAVRWLPITSSDGVDNSDRIHTTWRQARRDMLRIINRPSYRSILSLFLFALTPIPMGISEDEEADGVSGQVCIHAALQQVQSLRARHKNLHFNGSKMSLSSSSVPVCVSPESADTSGFINAENIAYWAAITFDTSAALTLNCRSLLSSGLFGFESEFTWKLVRTCLNVFNESSKSWCQGGSGMTDERANEIIAAAACWKLMSWKLAANFKEALRDGHDEAEVLKALSYVKNAWKEFGVTFRPFLDECHKRMQFLGQQTKLRWFALMLHAHLSILMVLDTIAVADRYDLLADLKNASIEAESIVMNTLAFGLHNTMTLRRDDLSSPGLPRESGTTRSVTFTVPLIAIDPYPHHVVAAVQLMRKAIDRDYGSKKITQDSYDSLNATLESALKHIPQSSKYTQAARQKFSSGL